MNKLSVNVAASGAVNNLLAVESACSTPRTPEILNSLIAMTNPLDNYTFNNNDNSLTSTKTANNNNGGICPSLMTNESSNSSGSNTIDTSPTSPPSVQHMCSQLIKAGLKLSIQSKRKHSSSGDSSTGQLLDLDLPVTKKRRIVTPGPPKDEISEDDDYERSLVSPNQGLTPEDEERRRRRRERNKIAATKCRLKKREKTVNLVYESETLETQNIELKTQIQELETQRRRLVDMLSMHTPSCMKVNNNNRLQYNNQLDPTNDCFVLTDDSFCHTTDDNCQQLPPVTTLSNAVLENALASYDRPASVDISTLAFRHQQTLNAYNRPASVGLARNDQYDTKPPNIVVSSHDSFTAQLTNLDNPGSPFTQYSCHNFDSTTSTGPTYTTGMDNGCMA